MNSTEFLESLKQGILEHPLFDDPFIRAISSPEQLNVDSARRFAALYYPHILRTRLYQANTLGITPDERIQFVLAEILYDEYGLGDISKSHMQQYRTFLRALDVVPQPANELEIIPELDVYIHTMMRISQSSDWLRAVAAVGIASEWAIPKLYSLFLQGLSHLPGIENDDLVLFSGHIELDLHHSSQIENALLPHIDSPAAQREIELGIRINLDARRIFHAGLMREVFETTVTS